MSARSKARKRAVDVLFEADQRGTDPLETLSGRVTAADPPVAEFTVELLIAETEPGLQGDRSTGGTKPATLETGHTIAVPLFITTGEKVKVDTRTGAYLGRA